MMLVGNGKFHHSTRVPSAFMIRESPCLQAFAKFLENKDREDGRMQPQLQALQYTSIAVQYEKNGVLSSRSELFDFAMRCMCAEVTGTYLGGQRIHWMLFITL